MAITYGGMVLFPTDIGNMSIPLVKSDTTRANLNPTDVGNFLKTLTSIQASTIFINDSGTLKSCTSPIGMSAFGSFIHKTVKVQSITTDNSIWDWYIDNVDKGTFFGVGTSATAKRASVFVLVECTDGYALCHANARTGGEWGYSAPSGTTLGYVVIDDPATSSFTMTQSGNSEIINMINDYFTANPPQPSPLQTTDPFDPAGNTDGTGGTSGGSGGGNFDHTSDPIDIPNLPTLSAADTGFITLFNPSAAQLRDLANYMWSNPLFDLDAWKKIFADPMDAILGLSIVPVNVPSGGTAAVTVGNISTGVSMPKATAQYVEVDCGSLNVQEFWGAYLDYAPYTKCEINLPYCGIHPIDIDDIMGKTVTVKYHIDILSGACCAYVKCGDSVLYEFVGQCAASIPITGDNWTNVINGVMQIAASVGSMVATGGLAAPVTGANAVSSVGKAIATDANIASTITSMKPSIEKSGSLGGVGGMLAIQKPYLILSRPRQALPANQNKYTGYPSFITFVLSDLEGYTEIEQIHLENVPATNAELDEIITLLKGGVIL